MKKKNIIMLSIIILFSNVVLCHAKVENKVPKVKIHYVKILDENSIKIGWKKINKIKKYKIQYSSNKNMRNSISKVIKKRKNCKVYQLKNKKNYYFRIRGVKGKMKGKWSKIKKVTLDSASIDIVKLINSKYNLKLSLNAKVINHKVCEERYEVSGKNYKGCKIFTKMQLSNSDFEVTDKLIQKSKNISYSIYDTAVEDVDWWDLNKKNIIKGQDFFNTIKVFENKEDNQGIVIRGHMEIYVARSIKQKYRLVYVCYEGG